MTGRNCSGVAGFGVKIFCHLLRTSMWLKQSETTGEVSRSSGGEPGFIIAVYRLQINSARVGSGWRKQTPGGSSVASVWKSKSSFCNLTSCFHSGSQINRRHFCAASEPRLLRCDVRAAQVSLRSRNSQLYRNAAGSARSFCPPTPPHPPPSHSKAAGEKRPDRRAR